MDDGHDDDEDDGEDDDGEDDDDDDDEAHGHYSSVGDNICFIFISIASASLIFFILLDFFFS